MKLIGIDIISTGRNDLEVVHYAVVIPLHPLQRGTPTTFAYKSTIKLK